MPNKTVYKYFLGRKVKFEKMITRVPNTEFGALYEAEEFLYVTGNYKTGSLDGNNPIGFNKEWPPNKWHNLSKEDKDKLNGVLVSSDFRNDSVKIIFFE